MKACPSFPGYSATADGRIFSHHIWGGRRRGVRIAEQALRELSQTVQRKGYRTASVSVNGAPRPIGVHVLVADAFLGPRPSPRHQVRHLDGNPANNNASNLAWGTALENAADRQRHGHYERGSRHHYAKLNEEQVRALLERRLSGEKIRGLASAFNVGVSTVEDILYGKTWRHVIFKPEVRR